MGEDMIIPEGCEELDARTFFSKEGQRAANLQSIHSDLNTVIHCCKELLKIDGNDEKNFWQEVLWTTALVKYARCFKTGIRDRLDRDLIKDHIPHYLEHHDIFIKSRDQHISHSVSIEEQYIPFVGLSKKSGNPSVHTVGCLHMKSIGQNSTNYKSLIIICELIIKCNILPEFNRMMSIFEQQEKKLSPEKLDSLEKPLLAVNSTEKRRPRKS